MRNTELSVFPTFISTEIYLFIFSLLRKMENIMALQDSRREGLHYVQLIPVVDFYRIPLTYLYHTHFPLDGKDSAFFSVLSYNKSGNTMPFFLLQPGYSRLVRQQLIVISCLRITTKPGVITA